jgi:4-amino-4-deoxy-L-arabinose transferase-like glycosyltransferase
MQKSSPRARLLLCWFPCLAAGVLFIALGAILIPYAGIEADEALFAGPYYAPTAAIFSQRIFHGRIPLMLMSYLGCLKTWLFWPLFAIWRPSPLVLRLPPLILGAMTIWLFYKLVDSTLGSRAALAATILLATDTMFLLTTCFDWGPVALQHFLMVAGVLLAVRFHRDGRRAQLAGACFCFGLAMWDKALFAWALIGLFAATSIVFPRELRRAFNVRNLAVALLAFVIGSAPLIRFNQRRHLETFRANMSLSTESLGQKAEVLRTTLNGAALFGYVVYEDSADPPKEPVSPLERASILLSNFSGKPRTNYLPAAFVIALLAAPLWWRDLAARRAILFSLVFMAVAWVQMIWTRGAGGSAHHVVLMWPLPHLILAAALAGTAGRTNRFGAALLAIAVALLAGRNLLVTNQYLAQFIRDGSGGSWTDAIYPLAKSLENTGASNIWVCDWGIIDPLRVLDRGLLPLRVGDDVLHNPQLDDEDRKRILERLPDTASLFVGHVPSREEWAGSGARLMNTAAASGYRKVLLDTVPDSHGRPVFEVFRFVRAAY